MEPSTRKRVVHAARFGHLVLYSVLIGTSLVMLYPMLFALAGSLCSGADFMASIWFPTPKPVTLENYRIVLNPYSADSGIWFDVRSEDVHARLAFTLWVANTLARIVWYCTVPTAIAILTGYVFARLEWKGRDSVFYLFLSTMMIPSIVYLIPTFIILARWPLVGGNNWVGQGGHGMINEWPALLITNLVSVFYTFLFRQTFLSIPRDFEEAAEIDGAGFLRTMWYVYLPMLKPTITVMVIFASVGIWNDYQWPLIVSSGNSKIWTMGIGVQQALDMGRTLKKGPGTNPDRFDAPYAFAMAVLMTIPPMLLFALLQRHFIEGMEGFSIKG